MAPGTDFGCQDPKDKRDLCISPKTRSLKCGEGFSIMKDMPFS